MISFGVFSLAEYYFRYYYEPNRKWAEFKFGAYRMLLIQSVCRLLMALYIVATGSSTDLMERYDPYNYDNGIRMFGGNTNMTLSLLCFTIYRWILFRFVQTDLIQYGHKRFYPELQLLSDTAKSAGIEYRLFRSNAVFEQTMRAVSEWVSPLLPASDRIRLTKLIFKLDAGVSKAMRVYFWLNLYILYVFYVNVIEPRDLSLFWTIEYCIDASISLLYTYDIVRYSTILASAAVYIITRFVWQMRSVTERLNRQVQRTRNSGSESRVSKLRRAIYKCHYVHVYVLLGNIDLNEKIVKRFYPQAVVINLICNVSIISGMATHGFPVLLNTPMKAIVVLQIGIITLVGWYFIASSTALVQPANLVFQSWVTLRKLNHRESRLHTRLMTFFEIIHHRKPFRFDFGPMGRVSKRSLCSFWGFYFGLILMVISDYISRHPR